MFAKIYGGCAISILVCF